MSESMYIWLRVRHCTAGVQLCCCWCMRSHPCEPSVCVWVCVCVCAGVVGGVWARVEGTCVGGGGCVCVDVCMCFGGVVCVCAACVWEGGMCVCMCVCGCR